MQDKIETTLASLDKVQRALPRPFFYTRVMARLNNSRQKSWERFSAFITKPSIAFAGVLLVIIMNIMAAYVNTPAMSDQSEVAITDDEYTQVATNFYDLENVKP